MSQLVFINLAVRDLPRSMDFFTELGFLIDAEYTDETAACVIFSDNIFAMLLTHDKMRQFTHKPLADPGETTGPIIALSADSRKKVDELVDKALELGANPLRKPDDYGFMYTRSFEDLDHHPWEIMWMDPTKELE